MTLDTRKSKYLPALPWLMALGDMLLINLAFFLSYKIRYEYQWFRALDPAYYTHFSAYIPFALLLTGILMVSYYADGAYQPRRGRHVTDDFRVILHGTATGIVLSMVVVFIFRPLVYSRLIFFYAAFLIILFLTVFRVFLDVYLRHLRHQGIGVERVVVVGAGEVGRAVIRNILAAPDLGYQIVGFVDDNPQRGKQRIGPFQGMGSITHLSHILDANLVDSVIITLPWQYHRQIMRVLAQSQHAGVRAYIVPDFFQLRLTNVMIEQLNGLPLIGMKEIRIAGWNLAVKRTMDLLVGGFMLLLLSPLWLLIVVSIRLDSPGPALFRQKRIGKNGQPFDVWKFRSMVNDAEEQLPDLERYNEADGPLFKIRDDPRITRVGKILRRLSLDELPQLINVLQGNMSLVGPRPALPREVEAYSDWHRKRLDVLPGLTGLWQVSGRSHLTFDEMVLLDIYYAENWSVGLDISILLRTIPKVMVGEGAY